MIDATLYQVGRNTRTQDLDSDHRRAQDEEQQMRDYKDITTSPATGRLQVELILPFIVRFRSYRPSNFDSEVAAKPRLSGLIHVRLFDRTVDFSRYWNRTPLMSFGRTGVIETCTFHSCPDIRGCTGMYCTAS